MGIFCGCYQSVLIHSHTAAAHAQRAAELLHSYQENPQPRPTAKEELEEVAELDEYQEPERPDIENMHQLDIFEPF